jgi:hypothetical protein
MNPKNTLCGRSADSLNGKLGGTYIYHMLLNGYIKQVSVVLLFYEAFSYKLCSVCVVTGICLSLFQKYILDLIFVIQKYFV